MGEGEKFASAATHRKLAVKLFNHTWDLMKKKDRTEEEDERMVHAAHASRFHWGEVGEPLNLAVGEWQIARVYSTLRRPSSALRHARRCLEIIEENGITGFHRASAYEGVAKGPHRRRRAGEERGIYWAREGRGQAHHGRGGEGGPLSAAGGNPRVRLMTCRWGLTGPPRHRPLLW